MLSRTDDQASGYRFVADELLHGRRSGLEGPSLNALDRTVESVSELDRAGMPVPRPPDGFPQPLRRRRRWLSLTRRSARQPHPCRPCPSTRTIRLPRAGPRKWLHVRSRPAASSIGPLVMLQPVVPTSIRPRHQPTRCGAGGFTAWRTPTLLARARPSVRRRLRGPSVGLARRPRSHPFHTKEQNHAFLRKTECEPVR